MNGLQMKPEIIMDFLMPFYAGAHILSSNLKLIKQSGKISYAAPKLFSIGLDQELKNFVFLVPFVHVGGIHHPIHSKILVICRLCQKESYCQHVVYLKKTKTDAEIDDYIDEGNIKINAENADKSDKGKEKEINNKKHNKTRHNDNNNDNGDVPDNDEKTNSYVSISKINPENNKGLRSLGQNGTKY